MLIKYKAIGSDGREYVISAEHSWIRVPQTLDRDSPRRTHELGLATWKLEDGRTLNRIGNGDEFEVVGDEGLTVRKIE